MVESDSEKDTLFDEEEYRLIVKQQSDLREVDKWDRYLYAPAIYWELVAHERICMFGDVAEVRRGITSGANDFFYLKRNEAKSWNIDSRFLRPIAKSIRQVDSVEFTKDDTDLLVIDVHGYVQESLDKADEKRVEGVKLERDTLPEHADLKELSAQEEYILYCVWNDEYRGLYRYTIHTMWEKDWGRYRLPHKRPTCQQHRKQNHCWFNLGELRIPDLMIPETCWERMFVMINRDELVADRNLYEVYTDETPEILAGILNSSMHRLFREIHGRITGGGANRFVVYEAATVPVVDLSKLSEDEEKEIISSVKEMIEEKEIKSDRLDRAVLSPLDALDYVDEISSYARALSKARREGKEVGVMIEGIEEGRKKVTKLKGADVVSSSQMRISDFVDGQESSNEEGGTT